MPWAVPVAIGGAALVGGISSYLGSRSQAKAATRAADQQAALGREQMAYGREMGGRGLGLVSDAGQGALSDLYGYYGNARGNLTDANKVALLRYGSGVDIARSDLRGGYGGAEASLNAGYDAAGNRLSPLSALSRYGEEAVATPLGANFQTDPGYQFRLQQGNDALAKAAAAAGGRISGAALKKLDEYNQGFASNEFNQAAQRDLAMRGMKMQLGQTGYGAINTLAGMDVNRGTGLANLRAQSGNALAGLDTSLGTYGANLASGEGTQLANLQTGLGTSLANTRMNLGAAQSNALQNLAAGQQNIAQSMIAPTYAAGVPYSGAGYGVLSNLANTGANTLAAYYGYGGGAGRYAAGGAGYGTGQDWQQVYPDYYSRTTGYGGGSY